MTERPRAHRFIENVSWSLLKVAVSFFLSFLLVPVLVHRLGKEAYGLYSLIGVTTGMFAVLTLGAEGASAKFAAEALGAGDARRMKDAFRDSLIFHAAFPVLAGLLLFFAASSATRYFSVPPVLAEQSVFLFRCIAVGSVFFLFGECADGVTLGLGRFDLASLMDVSYGLALLGVNVLLVVLGHGLRAIGLWFAGVNFVYAVVEIAVCLRVLAARAGSAHGGAQRPLPLRQFAVYAFPLFLSQMLWVLNFQSDKLFVAAMLPLSALTYYVIPYSLLMRLTTIPQTIAFASFQMAGELSGLRSPASAKRLYLKSTKLQGFVLAPALALLFAFGPQFLTLWLGADFSDHGTWPLRILVVGFGVYFLGIIPSSLAQGLDRPYYAVYTLAASAALSFCLWFLFIPRFGILAAAAGFALAQALATGGLLYVFHRDLVPVRTVEYAKEALAAPVGCGALLWAAAMLLHPRVDTWPRLVISIAAGVAAFYGASLLLLDGEEKQLLRRLLRRAETNAEAM